MKTEDAGIYFYMSHMWKVFKLARIPTLYNHQNYLVNSINELLLAFVIIEHGEIIEKNSASRDDCDCKYNSLYELPTSKYTIYTHLGRG